jgi:hypothetical protein
MILAFEVGFVKYCTRSHLEAQSYGFSVGDITHSSTVSCSLFMFSFQNGFSFAGFFYCADDFRDCGIF